MWFDMRVGYDELGWMLFNFNWCMCFYRLIWNHLVTILSFAINILMLLTWTAKASLATPGIMDNTTDIPESVKE